MMYCRLDDDGCLGKLRKDVFPGIGIYPRQWNDEMTDKAQGD
jgi:hypothetical protein